MATQGDRAALVVLRAHERVVPRGTERQTWAVWHERRWLNPKALPNVEVARLATGPGTVWESQASLTLAPGSWLRRVITRPALIQRRTPLEYLEREQLHTRRQTLVTYFRVGGGGSLVPSASPPPQDPDVP